MQHVRDASVAYHELETGFTCRGGHWSHEHTIAWEKIIRINATGIKASLSGACSDTTLRWTSEEEKWRMSGVTRRARKSGPAAEETRKTGYRRCELCPLTQR